MDNQQPNFEEYAQTLAKTMADAIAAAEVLQTEAHADRAAAIEDAGKMRELLHELEDTARRAAEGETLRLRKQMEQQIVATIAAKLKNAGRPEEEIATLLGALDADS
jgi:hypothetical protein